ncbi:MAG: hypothetical protein ACYCV6_02805 [Steroidobacteraceae bacterium]
MSQVSRSLSRSLLISALILPACALASGQVNLSPPKAMPAAATPATTEAPTPSPVKAVNKPVAAKPAHVLYAHPFRPHAAERVRSPIVRRMVRAPRRPRHVAAALRHHRTLSPGAVVVSTQGLNRFVFPAAVVKGPIFPADAPVLGSPVYLDGNRQILVQFVPGANKPFEMVVELAGHQVESYLLAPRNVPGVTYHARGVHPPRRAWKPSSAGADQGSAHHAEITLLRSVVMGDVPDVFYPTRLPPAVRFNKFDIVPRASWSDGSGHRILVYTLVSVHGQAAVVGAPEFYHKGMAAILLSGEVVDATHSPLLYILEGADRG